MDIKQNCLNILNLPGEILICILEFLDSLSLENIADASKRFSSILLDSQRLQSILTLNVHSKFNYKSVINRSKNLPFRTVNFMNNQSDGLFCDPFMPCLIDDVLVNLQKDVEKIQVINIEEFWPLKTFEICENLKELKLIDDSFLNLYTTENDAVFPVLKVLKIKCSRDCTILESMQAPKLEKLIIHVSCANLKKFLAQTEHLKSLEICRAFIDDLQGFDTLKLQLKSLNLRLDNSELSGDKSWTKTLCDLLKSQSSSLNDLALNFMTFEDDSYKIIKICLAELKLTKLSLKIDKNLTKFKEFSPSKSIKILNFQGSINCQNLKYLISCCPLVTNFTLNFLSAVGSNILDHISTSMPNLKYLEINLLLTSKISENFRLKNVEKLKVCLLGNEVWHELAMACPNLKELELFDETVQVLPINIVKVLFTCLKLEIITFNAGMNLYCMDGFFDVFMRKYVKVKRINFYAVNFEKLFFNRVGLLTAKTKIQVCCRNNLY